MQDIQTRLSQIKRHRLLISAAQAGQSSYRRKPHLRRLMGRLPSTHTEALISLIELEQHHNDKRQTRDLSYTAAAHIDVLIALQAEAALHKASLTEENSRNSAPTPTA